MELVEETLNLPGDESLAVTVYSAAPGAPAAGALKPSPSAGTRPASRDGGVLPLPLTSVSACRVPHLAA